MANDRKSGGPSHPGRHAAGMASLSVLLSLVPGGLAAQGHGLYISASVAPTLLVQTSHFGLPSGGTNTMAGISLAPKLGVRVSRRLGASVQAAYWWGAQRLEAYTGGLEYFLGARERLQLTTAFGALRQPVGFDCAGSCPAGPDYRLASAAAVQLGARYAWPVGGSWSLGPAVTWMRALAGGFRFHVVSVGVALTRQ